MAIKESVHELQLLRAFELNVNELSGDPDFPVSDLRRIISRIKRLAQGMSQSDIPVCLIWEWGNTELGGGEVSEQGMLFRLLSAHAKSELIGIVINRSGHVIEKRKFEMVDAVVRDSVFAAHVSQNDDYKKTVVFYFYGTELFAFFKGIQCEHIPNVFNENIIRGARNKYSDKAENYNQMIKRHFDDYVRDEQATSHWQNRPSRILRPAPESIFRNSLWKFLEENVVDAIRVDKEMVISGTTSKVDISIETTNSSYLIEVKWLGAASKGGTTGTKNGVKRALAGARQVIRYIDFSNGQATKGVLVMYDARNKDEDIPWGQKETHPLLDRDLRLWLKHDSASQA